MGRFFGDKGLSHNQKESLDKLFDTLRSKQAHDEKAYQINLMQLFLFSSVHNRVSRIASDQMQRHSGTAMSRFRETIAFLKRKTDALVRLEDEISYYQRTLNQTQAEEAIPRIVTELLKLWTFIFEQLVFIARMTNFRSGIVDAIHTAMNQAFLKGTFRTLKKKQEETEED